MATAMSQPTFALHPPVAEDTMEISSDFGHADNDIDIDFEHDTEPLHFGDDDQMIDDAKSDAGATNSAQTYLPHENDDLMVDDPVDDAVEDNGMMHDDTTVEAQEQEQDEELLDFSDLEPNEESADGTHEHLSDNTAMEPSMEDSAEYEAERDSDVAAESASGHLEVDGSYLLQSGLDEQNNGLASHDTAVSEPQTEIEPENLSEADGQPMKALPQMAVPQVTLDASEAQTGQSDREPSELDDRSRIGSPERSIVDGGYEAVKRLDPPSTAQPADETQDPELRLETHVSVAENQTADNEEYHGTPTVTGLHPTIVRYQGSEIALFPSSDPLSSEQYFLQDENLVHGSIGDMLQACRLVLSNSITADEELELSVEDLGLFLSEDSTSAFSTSFAEILDVYVKLQKQDGIEDVPPLYTSLSMKTRFTNRLTLLTQTVAEGKGLSQVPALQEYAYQDDTDYIDDDDSHTTIDQCGEEAVVPEDQAVFDGAQGNVEEAAYASLENDAGVPDPSEGIADTSVPENQVEINIQNKEDIQIPLAGDDDSKNALGQGVDHQEEDLFDEEDEGDTVQDSNSAEEPSDSSAALANETASHLKTLGSGLETNDKAEAADHFQVHEDTTDHVHNESFEIYDGEEQYNVTAASEHRADPVQVADQSNADDANGDELYYEEDEEPQDADAVNEFLDPQEASVEQFVLGGDQTGDDTVKVNDDAPAVDVLVTAVEAASHAEVPQQADNFDEIDFDDDFDEEPHEVDAVSNGTPLDLKRSWNQRAVEDDSNDAEQESKRSRPS